MANLTDGAGLSKSDLVGIFSETLNLVDLNKAETTSPASKPTKERISDLEKAYITLLERKVAKLEGQLHDGRPAPADMEKNLDIQTDDGERKTDDGIENNVVEDVRTPENSVKRAGEMRYRVIVSTWDGELGDYTERVSDGREKEEQNDYGPENQSLRAFTLRKLTMAPTTVSSQRLQTEAVSSEVEIESKALQRLLGKLTYQWGWTDPVLVCRSPYLPLLHSWQESIDASLLIVEGESDEEKQARIDLRHLIRIISTSSGHLPLDRYFKARHSFIEDRTVTHNALCSLFPPGRLILAHPFLDQPQLFSVQSCDGFVAADTTFNLVCYCFDFNGHHFNRVPFLMSIPYWGPDRRSIMELPFYPLKFHFDVNAPQGEEERSIAKLKQSLIDRGKSFARICTAEGRKSKMFKYTGDAHLNSGRAVLPRMDSSVGEQVSQFEDSSSVTISPDAPAPSKDYVKKKKVDGTTMVDFISFYEYLSPSAPMLGAMPKYEGTLETLSPERRTNETIRKMYKFDWDKHPPGKKMSDEQYMLCPPRVLGYALKQKKWAQLLVDRLQAPNKADASTFRDKLQLEDDLKELLQKSVQAHEKGKQTNTRGQMLALQDFAPDKGKGLVIMLYGYPGVGKTLTAESVALMAGKPLLSVGVSDIGIDGDKIEANLQKVFDLAGKWEAVLLFDEADVFLEARGEGDNDIRRNAMVSVLLRVLEYYEGILILTTNRMKFFDIAVQSRIHIAIKYEELNQEQQMAIFLSFLEQLRDKRLVYDFDDLIKWVKSLGRKYQFNGRQTRNVVGTALGLAMMEDDGDQKLRRCHLDRVAELTKLFKLDLKSQEEMFKRNTR